MTRWLLALLGLTIMASESSAQKPVKPDTSAVTVIRGTDPGQPQADTAALKKLAAGQGIDTAKAQFKFIGDTGWVWSPAPGVFDRDDSRPRWPPVGASQYDGHDCRGSEDTTMSTLLGYALHTNAFWYVVVPVGALGLTVGTEWVRRKF
jgi:hypothetical protein